MTTAPRRALLIASITLTNGAFAQSVSPIPDGARAELITTFSVVFGEGPVWHPDGYLLFSDLERGTIFKLDPANPVRDVYLRRSGGSNGLALDADTNLIMCRRDEADLSRLESDGTITVLASEYGGMGFNGPNDLTVSSRGTIFFTDPDQTQSAERIDGVYALLPSGTLHRVDSTLEFANGIALSPDEQTLYVDEGRGKRIYAYDIADDSTFANKRLLARVSDADYLDGMKVDSVGLLYVAGGGGLWIYSPEGKRIDKFPMSGRTTNLAWEGTDNATLYITKTNGVYKLELDAVTRSEIDELPRSPVLARNYPNPFNHSTIITFTLDRQSDVELTVYDLAGRVVRVLDSSLRGVGSHRFVWDGTDAFGKPVSSGTYPYRLRTNRSIENRTMVLAR